MAEAGNDPIITPILEHIYTSLHNDNAGLDGHIAALKNALSEQNQKSVIIDVVRLVQANRQGRKLMQAYFRQRGVTVNFSTAE